MTTKHGENSIQNRLMRVMLLTCTFALLLTCTAYFGYQYLNFRTTYLAQLSNIGKIIASNSTAALAFDSHKDANEILSSLKADPNIVAACLYDRNGKLFAEYPINLPVENLPKSPGPEGYRSQHLSFEGFQPVVQDNNFLGTLYIKTDMKALYHLFAYYTLIAILVFGFSLFIAYLLATQFQKRISQPILALAETSRVISQQRDYSVRATKFTDDEIGLLTDAFNQMLYQIETQNAEILSFNQKLEEKIKDRTQELEAANKELEAFSYSVSHDLRAPLRIVSGYASILEDEYTTALDDKGKKLLVQVKRNTNRMGNLIDGLLAFAQLGRKEIAKTKVNMNVLARVVVTDLEKSMEHHTKIRIGDLPPVMADYTLMSQVLTNLISNAIKYSSKKEGPVVEITAERRDGEIIYSVCDNGAGFDMQYAGKLFGVFQRLHNTEEFTGTGIGLAIVQRIIVKHGGRIWAESKLGEGAVFHFTLPEN